MRKALINNFLNNTDWAHAGRSNLAGDASFRRYIRLTQSGGERAMLMDAPPQRASHHGARRESRISPARRLWR